MKDKDLALMLHLDSPSREPASPEAAEAIRKAGADAIVTGTFIEQCSDDSKLKAVVAASKGL